MPASPRAGYRPNGQGSTSAPQLIPDDADTPAAQPARQPHKATRSSYNYNNSYSYYYR
ncbi:MAG: hypothetical protein ABSF26_07020 [Thermoguttaceae bacterium]